MSSDSMIYAFLALRSLHILAAALWLGSVALLVWFVMPAAGNLAPEMTVRLARRRHHAFMASVAGTTVLSGLLLYWHLTGFGAAGMGSRAGIVFGIGGLLGLAAAIIGGAVVGKGAVKIAELCAGEGARGSEAIATIQALGRRVASGGRAVLVLVLAALILMTVGHYV